ncbi:MAG TPA: hypothetical protein VEC39_14640 [Vicinamibacterales bacterium]|nr:hypothetical protein [Vicinamibacterales bacterium]
MGAFKIEIIGVGGHGCERKAKPGEKLYARCGRFSCPDCAAYDFTQRLRQAGMLQPDTSAVGQEVVHSPSCPANDVDGCTCNAVPKGAEVYVVDATGRIVYGGSTSFSAIPPGGKQYWRINQKAEFTHWPFSNTSVVDDMLANERKSGQF